MKKIAALILAAGKGTRMKSSLCKVLHPVAGRPMISYVIDAVRSCRADRIILVVGHHADAVKSGINQEGIDFVIQEPQLGTAHAVSVAEDELSGFDGSVLIICGDIPLIKGDTLNDIISAHSESDGPITIVTAKNPRPTGYGRIIRDANGNACKIVEEKDADESEKKITEINTGIYLVDSRLLYGLLKKVKADNAQKEYYLTDIVYEAVSEGIIVNSYIIGDFTEVSGINTKAELAEASAVIRNEVRQKLMAAGVTLLDPQTAFIDPQVHIGPDTVIHPVVSIMGNTVIGEGCVVESGVYVMDSVLGDGVKVLQGSRVDRSEILEGASIGPMAHIRPESRIGKNARIGNFVEVKKTVVGDGTKASHLTYLGDSRIGKGVNIGCGTITCNYDGRKKHPTIIHDGCFVGSDVQFVAPVEIGEGSLIGAGSTITQDVPPKTLAVSRSRQKNYPLRSSQVMGSKDEDRKP